MAQGSSFSVAQTSQKVRLVLFGVLSLEIESSVSAQVGETWAFSCPCPYRTTSPPRLSFLTVRLSVAFSEPAWGQTSLTGCLPCVSHHGRTPLRSLCPPSRTWRVSGTSCSSPLKM